MILYILSKAISMWLGLLYPAYFSYKAVKDRDVKEYVHWMMYWIVFSIYTFFEVFVDTFIGFWFPFYYELKIVFIIWLLSPQTRGGSFLYRRVIHPMFTRHETEIDAFLADFKLHTGNLAVKLGTTWMKYFMETAVTLILRFSSTEYAFNRAADEGEFRLDAVDGQDANINPPQVEGVQDRQDYNDLLYEDENERAEEINDNLEEQHDDNPGHTQRNDDSGGEGEEINLDQGVLTYLIQECINNYKEQLRKYISDHDGDVASLRPFHKDMRVTLKNRLEADIRENAPDIDDETIRRCKNELTTELKRHFRTVRDEGQNAE